MSAVGHECSSESDPRCLSALHGPQGALRGLICSCPIIGTVSAHIPSSVQFSPTFRYRQFSLTYCYRYSFRPHSVIGTVSVHIPSSVQSSPRFHHRYSFRPNSVIGTAFAHIPSSVQFSPTFRHRHSFLPHSIIGKVFAHIPS